MKIQKIKLPSPFPPNHTNAYLINDFLLVDAGVNSEENVKILEKFGDEVILFLTHPHADHFGAAYLFKFVYGHEITCKRLRDAEEEYFELVYHHFISEGLPESLAKKMQERARERYRGYVIPYDNCKKAPEKIKVDGDVFDVIHTPGHSFGHLCLYHKETKTIFCGDIVLENITPNPVIEPINEEKRLCVLDHYIKTLRELYNLEVRKAYPGHREIRKDWRELILSFIDNWRNRSLEIWRLADGKTAFEIATTLFPDIKQIFLAMTETIAHADFLLSNNLVEKRGVRYFRCSEREEVEELWRGIKERITRGERGQ